VRQQTRVALYRSSSRRPSAATHTIDDRRANDDDGDDDDDDADAGVALMDSATGVRGVK